MPRNTNNATLSYVPIAFGNGFLKYAFPSRIDESHRQILGQVVINPAQVDDTLIQNLVLGCNSPKPNIAKKKFATGSRASYIATAQIAAARAAGWKIQRTGRARTLSKSSSSETKKVTINGLNYAWQYTFPPSGLSVDPTPLGVVPADPNDNLVWGCEFPKPPRMRREFNDGADSFSTFCDPSNLDQAAQAGWSSADNNNSALYTAAHFAAMV